jgi:hypothetical protein
MPAFAKVNYPTAKDFACVFSYINREAEKDYNQFWREVRKKQKDLERSFKLTPTTANSQACVSSTKSRNHFQWPEPVCDQHTMIDLTLRSLPRRPIGVATHRQAASQAASREPLVPRGIGP